MPNAAVTITVRNLPTTTSSTTSASPAICSLTPRMPWRPRRTTGRGSGMKGGVPSSLRPAPFPKRTASSPGRTCAKLRAPSPRTLDWVLTTPPRAPMPRLVPRLSTPAPSCSTPASWRGSGPPTLAPLSSSFCPKLTAGADPLGSSRLSCASGCAPEGKTYRSGRAPRREEASTLAGESRLPERPGLRRWTRRKPRTIRPSLFKPSSTCPRPSKLWTARSYGTEPKAWGTLGTCCALPWLPTGSRGPSGSTRTTRA